MIVGVGKLKNFVARRRDLLGGLSMLPVSGWQEKAVTASPTTGATWEPFSVDRFNFARLKALKLDDPKTVARQKRMPAGKIGDATIGRLICGSNLIGMNMHARDLP
jgi:hypothetical protein